MDRTKTEVGNRPESTRGALRVVVTAVIAALVISCVVLLLASRTGQVSTFHVVSGSMEPALKAGDVILSRWAPAGELEEGDIVTVQVSDGTYVTHRIVEVHPSSATGQQALTLQGDANEVPDKHTYTVAAAYKHIATIPSGAHLAAFFTTPPTSYYLLLVLGGLAGMVLIQSTPVHENAESPRGNRWRQILRMPRTKRARTRRPQKEML